MPGLRCAVRAATLADAAGLSDVHARCRDPWAKPETAAIWLNHRLLAGFLVDAALAGSRVVGHAEWLVCNECSPAGRYLYLSALQVSRRFRRRGVGQALMAAGLTRARRAGCRAVVTNPDRGSEGFYRACGMRPADRIVTCVVPPRRDRPARNWSDRAAVPCPILRRLPMRLGWAQASSTHMWQVLNRPVVEHGEQATRPCLRRNDGKAWVQVERWKASPSAHAVCWASPEVSLAELVSTAAALAGRTAAREVRLRFLQRELPALPAMLRARCRPQGSVWVYPCD